MPGSASIQTSAMKHVSFLKASNRISTKLASAQSAKYLTRNPRSLPAAASHRRGASPKCCEAGLKQRAEPRIALARHFFACNAYIVWQQSRFLCESQKRSSATWSKSPDDLAPLFLHGLLCELPRVSNTAASCSTTWSDLNPTRLA